ncbi:kinase non-catalytic C-lobe domain-containing protein 1 isoform X1 [Rousettus aegyptiacus]|uniref:Kinase non-catalytic C-lobe domain containing 1 n=1 Tax=Rousettus aegyptiacus TaxID=9407 RepID=A0A7J8GA63_ROUAE|nr:kinase non-catalytic C-lobe domain-containing protein 1 isoform X1 [Rousettus aegyptiacus]KAF6456691.1 kinase non-catalytic C-lobe domain containing 1 [Rousettus aegyptiacus]
MEPAAAGFFEDDKDLDFYDFEPLPTLPEDEENVSLADILSLRDSGLSEQEAWAVCLECSLSVRSVARSAIFQTLCITPDTLAFNTSGNVCFMELLSDDPEGAFVPPEFDVTGNTFEAHVYSLGATLRAALEYVAEPAPRLSRDLEALLGQMQAEDPAHRPDLESIIALCEEKMPPTSSCRLCRSLAAVGRRVLSIESFSAFQDVTESTWKGRLAPKSGGLRRQTGDHGTDPGALPAPKGLEHPGTPAPMSLVPAPLRNGERPSRQGLASLVLDAPWPLQRGHSRDVQAVPQPLPKGPGATALCLTTEDQLPTLATEDQLPTMATEDQLPTMATEDQLPTMATEDQLPMPRISPAGPREASPGGQHGCASSRAQPQSRLWPEQEPECQQEEAQSAGHSGDGDTGVPGQHPVEGSHPPRPEDAGGDTGTVRAAEDEQAPKAAAEQGVSLQELVSRLARPFKDYELWALCHACLRALHTHRQHPAVLCLDSVLVAKDGAVRFGPPPAFGSDSAFFLAPEVAEQELATEKASVYSVAAVLWTAAKSSVPRDHKLALPRRLKTLLLHMAGRSAQERPSVAEAVEVCSSYLLQQGMDSGEILARLGASACQALQGETVSLHGTSVELQPSTAPAPAPGSGFVRAKGDPRLEAVQGPVSGQPSHCGASSGLPGASTFAATHFRPTVLAPDTGAARDMPAQCSGDSSGKEPTEAHAAAARLQGPDPPAPGPEPRGAASESPREVMLGDSAQGCPCSPAQASSLAPPPKAQEPGPEPWAPPRASAGDLRPQSPGPSLHLAPPPRSTASEGPGPERKGPRPAPRSPPPAGAHPGSPGNTPVREQDDQAPGSRPERRPAADRGPPPPGADAGPLPRTACASLQEATRLIREEFAFDGYLDNGLEALIMGEYIHALKDLTYATFCGAVSEKFCDLYWGERLLQSLFRVVNGRTLLPKNASDEAGSSQPAGGGRTPTPSPQSGTRPSPHGAGKERPAACSGRAPGPPALAHANSDELSRGNLEVGFRPQKSVKAEREPNPAAAEDRQPAGGASDAEAVARPARSEEGGPAVSPGLAASQSCSPGWSSAFYEEDCFGADIRRYVQERELQRAGGAPHTPSPELEQQLMMEKRNYGKTLKFYQKLLQKEKRTRGSEVKTMLSRLRGQLEEMQSRAQFLGLAKRYLQVLYAEQWGLEPCALPMVVNVAAAHCDTLDFSPLDESSSLIFYNVSKQPRAGRHQEARVLQAGTPLGLMAYLYSSGAFLEGYVQQFLYTFRYFCTPQDFLHFLLDRMDSTLARAQQDPSSTFSKIYRRSFCLLQAWVEDCQAVDLARNAALVARLEGFISSKILPLDGSAEHLLGLLEVGTDRRASEGAPRGTDLGDPREAEEDVRPLNALCRRLSEDGIARKSFPWRLSRSNGLALPHHKERQYTIASALPKPCFLEDFCGPYAKASMKGPYFLTEYSAHQLFAQLTLLQQELFQKCHPVHFLNSRALGVTDQSAAIPKATSESLPAKTCSLFPPSYVQDKYLLRLLRSADDVSTWVAAEIVTCHTSKLQVTLLSKFLLIAKSCYEQRNFATAMQILGGLEHLAVRQSSAWRILPAKMAEVMEELKAVEVFLKSDSLCLMEGRRSRAPPTLPSARLLAMHIQQLETGGFTMTNGAHRWSKLRNIAKVASQVHAFQENPYTFAPDPKLQSCLQQRIARFSGADVSALAAGGGAGPQRAAGDKHRRGIQGKLRRMRATFQ